MIWSQFALQYAALKNALNVDFIFCITNKNVKKRLLLPSAEIVIGTVCSMDGCVTYSFESESKPMDLIIQVGSKSGCFDQIERAYARSLCHKVSSSSIICMMRMVIVSLPAR